MTNAASAAVRLEVALDRDGLTLPDDARQDLLDVLAERRALLAERQGMLAERETDARAVYRLTEAARHRLRNEDYWPAFNDLDRLFDQRIAALRTRPVIKREAAK